MTARLAADPDERGRGRGAGERADSFAARQQRRPRRDRRRGALAHVPVSAARSLRGAAHARRGAAVATSFQRRDRGSEQGDGRRSARRVELRRRRRRLHGAGRLHTRLRGVRSNGAVAARAAGLCADRVRARDQGRSRRRARIHAPRRGRHLAERCRIASLALRAGWRSAAAAWPRRRRRGSNTNAPTRRFRAIRWRSSGWRA